MPEVLFRSGTGNEVVNVCIGKGNTMEDLIHETVKCLSGVPQSERHLYKLK